MDAALHGRAEPLAGLFTGTVIANEAKSGVGEAPSRRITAAVGSDVGTCAGPLSCARLAPLVRDLKGSRYFLCGPSTFMDVIAGWLRSEGVPADRVHSEQFHAAPRLARAG